MRLIYQKKLEKKRSSISPGFTRSAFHRFLKFQKKKSYFKQTIFVYKVKKKEKIQKNLKKIKKIQKVQKKVITKKIVEIFGIFEYFGFSEFF